MKPADTFAPTDIREKRKRYGALRSKLWSERSTFDSHWSEIANLVQPRRTRFQTSDKNKGDKRHNNILDNTALLAVRTLKSGMHAGLTSPARPWFRLMVPNPKLRERPNVQAWLHEVREIVSTIFLQSNVYNSLPIFYGDMGCFGTAAMSLLEDAEHVIRTETFPIGSYALGLDKRKKINTFVCEYELTVSQVIEEFGLEDDGNTINWSNISEAVKRMWMSGNTQESVMVSWVVSPNLEYTPDRLGPKGMKFSSCYFETASNESKLLKESGFRTFPIMAARWDITGGDSYGTECPGMDALGDVKQLQIQQRKKGQAITKLVDPPLVGPTSLRTQKPSLLSGDITYEDVRDGMKGLRPIHEIALNLDHLRLDIAEVQGRCSRAFYQDLFLMLAQDRESTQPITAEEVRERHEEKLLMLGPVLERTNDELLDPMIDRTYEIAFRLGLIPDIPDELDGVDFRPEYISIMAQAQKLVHVVASDRFLATVLPLAQTFPEVRHKIDVMRIIDNYVDALGVDPRMVRPTEEAEQMAQAEQQQIAAAQQAAQAKDQSVALKNAATSPMEGDTALSRIVAGVQGAAVGGL